MHCVTRAERYTRVRTYFAWRAAIPQKCRTATNEILVQLRTAYATAIDRLSHETPINTPTLGRYVFSYYFYPNQYATVNAIVLGPRCPCTQAAVVYTTHVRKVICREFDTFWNNDHGLVKKKKKTQRTEEKLLGQKGKLCLKK